MSFYKIVPKGVLLSVRLQPKSSRNQIVGVYKDALKIKISAPPIKGQANEQVREFLAKIFNIAKSAVVLKQGEKSKDKVFLLKSISEEQVVSIINNQGTT
ncbi:MAG: YggU family protein [Candidatus Margulisbacteria bacterium]|nr:YggU family protein [Candidatus Margulisiibacteriota bacterium]